MLTYPGTLKVAFVKYVNVSERVCILSVKVGCGRGLGERVVVVEIGLTSFKPQFSLIYLIIAFTIILVNRVCF